MSDLINEIDDEHPTTLAEAEANARQIAERRPRGPHGVLMAEYDRRGREMDRLAKDRDANMAGLLAAILPNLDPDTAARVGDEIRRLARSRP